MDVNVLIVCITVVVCLLIIGATALACFEKHAELNRPRRLAEFLAAPPLIEDGDEDE